MSQKYTVLSPMEHSGLRGDDEIFSFQPLAYVRDGSVYVVELFAGEAAALFPPPEWERLTTSLDTPSQITPNQAGS